MNNHIDDVSHNTVLCQSCDDETAVCFIVPPHIEARTKQHRSVDTRNGSDTRDASGTRDACEEFRRRRGKAPILRNLGRALDVTQDTQDVYSAKETYNLPGWIVAKNQEEATKDSVCECIRKCWVNTNDVLAYYKSVLGYDLAKHLYGQVVSSLNVGKDFNNAFFTGDQMAYGEGDGVYFKDFCYDETVICHELGHGVVDGTVSLVYKNESGALNESFADVFAICYLHYKLGKPFAELTKDDWMIGEKCVVGHGALRSFTKEPCRSPFHPLGADTDPKHYKNAYHGTEDNGGVHINSGVINHAFYRVCKAMRDFQGGNTWEAPLKMWFSVLLGKKIDSNCTFNQFTAAMINAAKDFYGPEMAQKVTECFVYVGLPYAPVAKPHRPGKKRKLVKQVQPDKHVHHGVADLVVKP